MKVFILNTGYLETDANNITASSTVGTRTNPIVSNKWIKLPVMCFLIEKNGEYILYDLGCNPNAMKGHWPEYLKEVYPFYQKEEEKLENQLLLCGVEPKDIKKIVVSHMHLDHIGNLELFKHADVYVSKDEFYHAQAQVRLSPNVLTHGGYVKNDLDIIVKQYHLVDKDFTLIPGVDIINLPGHTPGLLGIVVHLEKEGTLILPQDCIYTEENYGPPAKASGLLYDSLKYFDSIEKVRELQEKYNAQVIFAHDYDFFKKLKLAPEFYE